MSFLESVREPEFREIFRFWLKRCRGGGVPVWHGISPAEIDPRFLPFLFLFAREEDGRFRCKLVGTELCRASGLNQTGRHLNAILPPAVARRRAGLFRHVLDTGRPLYYRGLEVAKPGEFRRCSRILLPVASSGPVPDLVFGMARFGPPEELSGAADKRQEDTAPRQIVYASEQDLATPGASNLVDFVGTTA